MLGQWQNISSLQPLSFTWEFQWIPVAHIQFQQQTRPQGRCHVVVTRLKNKRWYMNVLALRVTSCARLHLLSYRWPFSNKCRESKSTSLQASLLWASWRVGEFTGYGTWQFSAYTSYDNKETVSWSCCMSRVTTLQFTKVNLLYFYIESFPQASLMSPIFVD